MLLKHIFNKMWEKCAERKRIVVINRNVKTKNGERKKKRVKEKNWSVSVPLFPFQSFSLIEGIKAWLKGEKHFSNMIINIHILIIY